MDPVTTGAIALIRINGKIIGHAKDISVDQNVTRGRVKGIGRVTPRELPGLEWAGSATVGYYLIDYRSPAAMESTDGSVENYVNRLLLDTTGFTFDLFKKEGDLPSDLADPVEAAYEPFCSVHGVHIKGSRFQIQENAIGSENKTFDFLHPVVFYGAQR